MERRRTAGTTEGAGRGVRPTAGDATRERIMTSAERLFSKRGIDAVSVRDITDAAKVNSAAIHYHFGSKRGLVEALLTRWAGELVERRGRLLDTVEEAPELRLRDVVEVLVAPMVELATARRRGGGYVGFLAAVLNHPEYIPLMNELYEPDISRTLKLLEQVTPHLSRDVRMLRWAIAKDVVNRTVGHPGSPVNLWLDHYAPGGADAIGERLVDLIVGMFAAEATV